MTDFADVWIGFAVALVFVWFLFALGCFDVCCGGIELPRASPQNTLAVPEQSEV